MAQCNTILPRIAPCDDSYVVRGKTIEVIQTPSGELKATCGSQLYVIMPGGKRVDLRTQEGKQAIKDLAAKHRK